MAKRESSRVPWGRSNPKKKSTAKKARKSKTLSGSEKSEARARAREAGRPYPNLVDNMAVARTKGAKKKTIKKKSAKKAAKKR